MGQQQLLLLVLSTVIVGLATVAGIQAFSENQQQQAVDALNQKVLDYATKAQAAASQPTAMGGISSISAATPVNLDLAQSTGDISTAQGNFAIGGTPSNYPNSGASCSAGNSELQIAGYDPTTGATACAVVTGTDGIDDITTKTKIGS